METSEVQKVGLPFLDEGILKRNWVKKKKSYTDMITRKRTGDKQILFYRLVGFAFHLLRILDK